MSKSWGNAAGSAHGVPGAGKPAASPPDLPRGEAALPLAEVDEVWLGLEQAYSTLLADGHKPSESPYDCRSCFVLGLIKRAMKVYRERQAAR